jgi:hypothetical protein
MFNTTGHKRNVNQITLRFHFIPLRMVIIKNIIKSKCWQTWGKVTLIHC